MIKKINLNENNEAYIKLDNINKKLPVFFLLIIYGISLKKIFSSLTNKKIILEFLKKKKVKPYHKIEKKLNEMLNIKKNKKGIIENFTKNVLEKIKYIK